jgi:hypothetical protein
MPVVAKTLRPRPEPKSTISGRTLVKKLLIDDLPFSVKDKRKKQGL